MKCAFRTPEDPADIEKIHGTETAVDLAVEYLIARSGAAFVLDKFVSIRKINDALAFEN